MIRHVALNDRGAQMVQSWVGAETAECDLGDARLNRRLGTMLEVLGERPGKSLPTAFQDWSNTEAAYRFFSNGNVSEDKILAGHFSASALLISATDGRGRHPSHQDDCPQAIAEVASNPVEFHLHHIGANL
jgi:hypothetical protein